MLKKGTALPIKKIIGVGLLLYLISDLVYHISFLEIPYLKHILIGIASYFLLISGRQL